MYANPVNFEHEAFRLLMITGIISGIIGYILSGYTAQKAIKEFQKENPEEEIKCIFEIPFSIRFMLPFILGDFVGYYLVPFFLYENVKQIEMVTRNNLPLYVLWLIMCFFCLIIFIYCNQTLVTNNRIVTSSAYKLQNKLQKHRMNVHLENIKHVRGINYYFTYLIEIIPYEGRTIVFGSFKNTKKGYEILRNEWLKNNHMSNRQKGTK